MNVDHRDLHVLTHCFPTLRSSELYRSATAVPAWVSPVARRTSSSGCCAHRRSSSAPVKPDAPTMPIEIIARSCKILHDHANQLQPRSVEHTSELQPLMRISYAVFCLHKSNIHNTLPVTYNI